MSVFRSLIPPSEANSNFERLEFCLVWLSPDSGVRQWLFTHTDNEETENTKSITVETLNSIRSTPYEKIKDFKIKAESLDSERFDYVASIMESNQIYRVSKTNEITPMGIDGGRKRRGTDLKEFLVEITISEREGNVLNL